MLGSFHGTVEQAVVSHDHMMAKFKLEIMLAFFFFFSLAPIIVSSFKWGSSP